MHADPEMDNTRGWQRAPSQAVDGFCQRALLRELRGSPSPKHKMVARAMLGHHNHCKPSNV